MLKKVIISGSATLQKELKRWCDYWNNQKGYVVINYPKIIDKDNFITLYPKIHTEFLKNINEADILFVANENKNNIAGYLGAETFSEIGFAVAQNLINNQNIKVILAKMPSKKVQSFNEIELWLKLGWLELLR